jgi:cytochrome c peroxidase
MKGFVILGVVVVIVMAMLSSFSSDEPADEIALGKLLFFNPILSKDKSVSCASCHKPNYAFADTFAISIGVDGKKGTRNTPTAMNQRLGKFFFWDGRAKSLEEQALAPIANPVEMNLPVDEAVKRLKRNKNYNAYFKTIFNGEPTAEHLAKAIAAFERSLETSNSPFDNWKFYDDASAVSDAAQRGFAVLNEKGKCVKCHFGADLTTHEFRNIGLFDSKLLNDSGRFAVTKREEDIGKFKTSSLRNVAVTAPYMHNGMFATLEEVIEFYNDIKKVVPGAINTDTILAKPLNLTKQEKDNLKAFLLSLTDKQFIK